MVISIAGNNYYWYLNKNEGQLSSYKY